ncbi:hypothetical protein [Volucribacter amazonae]|uniref:Uncharacterized protein n=1 Tax=Volucribacter amazonae TaxID=256731 RepID=A0A9X4PIK3_9PAST|nr:hypothetical protein [Volucribacter amazonae]MDG6895975.1 hypothetical protein [Volucribacter amazonae]
MECIIIFLVVCFIIGTFSSGGSASSKSPPYSKKKEEPKVNYKSKVTYTNTISNEKTKTDIREQPLKKNDEVSSSDDLSDLMEVLLNTTKHSVANTESIKNRFNNIDIKLPSNHSDFLASIENNRVREYLNTINN